MGAMAVGLVRRIVYGALAVWVFALAVEEFRLGGHFGAGAGLAVGGIVLAALAFTGKGG